MKTDDNKVSGSFTGKHGQDSILIRSANKSTVFHFGFIIVYKAGVDLRGGGEEG